MVLIRAQPKVYFLASLSIFGAVLLSETLRNRSNYLIFDASTPPTIDEKILWLYSLPDANFTLEQIPLHSAVSTGLQYTAWDKARQYTLRDAAQASSYRSGSKGTWDSKSEKKAIKKILIWGEVLKDLNCLDHIDM
jgi:hypothetical protein